MIIAIDFDGTCVTHEYPKIGKDIGAAPILSALVAAGHRLILLTMRSGVLLEEAVAWFKSNDIELWGVNQNPEQHKWTTSPKVYAMLYIDDAALGAPTILDEVSDRDYIDWPRAEDMLIDRGLL